MTNRPDHDKVKVACLHAADSREGKQQRLLERLQRANLHIYSILEDGATLEKGITPVKTRLYVDNSIHGYLQDMAAMGEDTEEYSSIWYYY